MDVPYNFKHDFISVSHIKPETITSLSRNTTFNSRLMYSFARLLVEQPQLEDQVIILSDASWLKSILAFFNIYPNASSCTKSMIDKSKTKRFKIKSINTMVKRLRPTFFNKESLKNTLKYFFRFPSVKDNLMNMIFGSSTSDFIGNGFEYGLILSWKNKKHQIVEVHIVELFRKSFKGDLQKLCRDIVNQQQKEGEVYLLRRLIFNNDHKVPLKTFLKYSVPRSYYSSFVNVSREKFLQSSFLGILIYSVFSLLNFIDIRSRDYDRDENILLENFLWKWYHPTVEQIEEEPSEEIEEN